MPVELTEFLVSLALSLCDMRLLSKDAAWSETKLGIAHIVAPSWMRFSSQASLYFIREPQLEIGAAGRSCESSSLSVAFSQSSGCNETLSHHNEMICHLRGMGGDHRH